jgi:hypothetical protein
VEVTVSPVVELTPRHREQLEDEVARIAAFLGTEVTLVIGPPR